MNTYVTGAWSSTMRLVTADPTVLTKAAADFEYLLAAVDRIASRFRPDSALSAANRNAGKPTPVPTLLVDLVAAALEAAEASGGRLTIASGGTGGATVVLQLGRV